MDAVPIYNNSTLGNQDGTMGKVKSERTQINFSIAVFIAVVFVMLPFRLPFGKTEN